MIIPISSSYGCDLRHITAKVAHPSHSIRKQQDALHLPLLPPPPHPYASSSQASSLSSRAHFSRVPFSFQALKAVLCLLDLQSRSNFNNVESDTMKLSVNEAKLTGFWARNYATIQQVLILKFSFKPEKLLGLLKKCNPEPIYTIGCRVNRDKVEQSFGNLKEAKRQ